MKRFLCVCMCIFILTISVLTYFPVYAADSDFTLSIDYNTVCNMHPSLSSSEAHSAVMNHGDIYGSDHKIVFQYTPTSSYNWSAVGSFSDVRMSDKQLETFLQCNNSLSSIGQLFKANAANNPIIRTLVSGLGAITTGDSDLLTGFYDKLTSNVNYLNAIEYDSSSGDLTLLADQVSALREDLKKQYYLSNGMLEFKSSGETAKALSGKRKYYEEEEYFLYDCADIRSYQCAFAGDNNAVSWTWDVAVGFNRDYSYVYFSPEKDKYSYNVVFVGSDLTMCDSIFKTYLCGYYSSNWDKEFDLSSNLAVKFNGMYLSTYSEPNFFNFTYSFNKLGYSFYRKNDNSDTELASFSASSNPCYFYSNDNKPFIIFKSYEAMYNFAYCSQTAYLSSKVEQAGEDIKLSINDMNDNIGSKIDDLIDSINNKKEGMSSDELQDAIDKALDSISGKIDNIGDNTQQTNNKLDALLESVSGTNQILMQILGVTTDIRDIVKTKDQEGNQYTMSDVKDCFNTMFNNLKYSILYGKNVTNNPDAANVSTAAYVSYSNISTYADTTTSETLDYKDGLLGKFPFSVPYQMYEWLQVLQVDEKVPQFTYNYGFLIGHKGKQEYDLTFDLSKYQPWADVLKSFLRLSFTLIMSVFIYNKFKGEM